MDAIWDYYEYARDREKLYKDFGDQLDMLYNDIKNGNLENGEWVKHVESVKAQIPKPIDEPPDVESWTMDNWVTRMNFLRSFNYIEVYNNLLTESECEYYMSILRKS